MSEITKLYENAGIKPTYTDECQMADSYYSMAKDLNERGILFDDYMKQECPNKNEVCYETCPYAYNKEFYPPFTAEKQILLLQLLARIESADYFQFFFYEIKQEWVFRLNMLTELSCESAYIYESRNKNFDECIAGLINIIWQDLTEEEKQQVKGILE